MKLRHGSFQRLVEALTRPQSPYVGLPYHWRVLYWKFKVTVDQLLMYFLISQHELLQSPNASVIG